MFLLSNSMYIYNKLVFLEYLILVTDAYPALQTKADSKRSGKGKGSKEHNQVCSEILMKNTDGTSAGNR